MFLQDDLPSLDPQSQTTFEPEDEGEDFSRRVDHDEGFSRIRDHLENRNYHQGDHDEGERFFFL
jgi:hypothetical protein